MKTNLRLLLTLAVLALTGCSSTPTTIDSGVIHARTFNFVNRKSKPGPNFADNTESVHTMIQNAITNNLTGKGFSRANAGGDVTIAYLVIKGDNVSTTNDDTNLHCLALIDQAQQQMANPHHAIRNL